MAEYHWGLSQFLYTFKSVEKLKKPEIFTE